MPARTRSPRAAAVVAAAAIAVVVVLLTVPHHVDGVIDRLAAWLPLSGADAGVLRGRLWWAFEDGANAVLFVPIGFAVAWWSRRWWVGLLTGVAISVACETAQLWIPLRVASPLDVLCNTIGTALGVLLAAAVVHRDPQGRARRA